MRDWLELFLRLVVIINPIAALALWTSLSTPLAKPDRRRLGVTGGCAAFVLLFCSALAADWLLGLVDVSAPTWQMGAGLLLLLGVVPVFVRRDPFLRDPYGDDRTLPGWAMLRMTLNVATPATLAALVYFGAAWERADLLIALALIFGLTVLGIAAAWSIETRIGRWPLREAGRAFAAILVLLAVGMAVDGINSV